MYVQNILAPGGAFSPLILSSRAGKVCERGREGRGMKRYIKRISDYARLYVSAADLFGNRSVFCIKVTEELVASGAVNARNLAQLLWSLGKLGNPWVPSGYAWSHAEERRWETSPERFGEDRKTKDNKVRHAEGA